jgi:head-tail adaptor
MGLSAGRLTHVLAFESRDTIGSGEPDDGNTEGAFVERFTTAAGRKFLRGGEDVMAARLEGVQPATFFVRYFSDTLEITTDWRIRDTRTGVYYAILAVTPWEDRSFIDILAQSGVAT